MIKGVTKSIIEITPRSACFEKLIVILSNSCEAPDKEEIQRQAELIAGSAPKYLKRQLRMYRLKLALSAVLGAFTASGLLVVLYLFV